MEVKCQQEAADLSVLNAISHDDQGDKDDEGSDEGDDESEDSEESEDSDDEDLEEDKPISILNQVGATNLAQMPSVTQTSQEKIVVSQDPDEVLFEIQALLGFSLVGIASLLMYLNEKRQVLLQKLMQKASDEIIESEVDDIDRLNDDKLVQAIGMSSTQKPIIDERFNIVLESTVRLRRVVQVF